MKSKLKKLNYQRNGIMGIGFYVCEFQNISEGKGNFIATFETVEEGAKETVNITNCRVIETSNLYDGWRGDRIANDIQTMLDEYQTKNNLASWYDITSLLRNKANKNENYIVRYKS